MKIFFIFFLFLAAPLLGNEFCGENARKHYCSPAQIELNESAILVHHEEGVVEVDTLCVDQGGLFFMDTSVRCTDCRRPINPKNTCQHSLCNPNS